MANQINIKIPDVFHGLYTDARYYVYYGGRGSGKSWSIAQYLICMALSQPLKILCTREFQNSILESVYSLLKGIISRYKLGQWFNCKLNTIECYNGSVFIFKGLAHNIESVKSTEGIDLCWIEEADKVSQTSWDTLIPTIRKPNSKIIVTFNPTNEDDPVYSMFITSPPGDAVVQKVNYNDNPHFPAVLEKEMLHLKATDYEKYMHVWEGQLRTISDAQVFKNKFVVDTFDSKEMGIENFYHGMDFGFANDPSAVVRLFIKGRDLFIEHECFG
ncbi:MAG: PBSX family phage terminase large subunit, partial [Lentisphaerota bacterium]